MQSQFFGAVVKQASTLYLLDKQLKDALETLESIQRTWPHELDDYLREEVDECTPIKDELLGAVSNLTAIRLQISELSDETNEVFKGLSRVRSAE